MTSVRFKIELPRPKAAQPKPPKLPCAPGPSRLARRLALAYWIERNIEAGNLADYATAARALGLSRARLTQVVNMLLLTVEVQEDLLLGRLGGGSMRAGRARRQPSVENRPAEVAASRPA